MNGKTMSINREEILALTRRMTVKRTSMTRIAGCYADAEGFIDGTFNVNFLKLSPAEREKKSGACENGSICTDQSESETLCISRI